MNIGQAPMNGQPNQRKPRRLRFASQQNPLSRIPQWSIEHPYAVIAFYVAVLALAFIAIGRMPRRFAPYVQSPLIGVVTMMHY